MAETSQETAQINFSMRTDGEDRNLVSALRRKLGLTTSAVLRYAIRVLAEKEGVRQ